MHPAVTQNRKVLAQADLGDFNGGQKIRFLWPIEQIRQGDQNGIVMLRVVPELRNGLSDEHIEPVQRLGLMGVNIVIGLGQNSGGGQAGWRGGSFVVVSA